MPGSRSTARTSDRAASASASPPMPAQRSTTSGQANRAALCRATGSEVACSTPVGSTHICWPRSNFTAALLRAWDRRIAAETAAGEASFRNRARSAGPDRSNLGDLGEQAAAGLGRQDPGLGVDGLRTAVRGLVRGAGLDLDSSPAGIGTTMEPLLHVSYFGEESVLLEHRDRSIPAVPPIVREPLRLGQVPIPSRFFLAPLAGYTSLAFRLAVRECGGLGLATTDLVNARSLIEGRRRALRAGRDLRARPPAVDPDLRDRHRRDGAGRPRGSRSRGPRPSISTWAVRSEKSSRPAAARRSCARWIGPPTWSPRSSRR